MRPEPTYISTLQSMNGVSDACNDIGEMSLQHENTKMKAQSSVIAEECYNW